MIGTDIEHIARFNYMAENPTAVTKFLTEKEYSYWVEKGSRVETLAGFWCAKEAVVKALGTGFGELNYWDVEIRHTLTNEPYAFVKTLGIRLDVSISHTEDICIAVALKI